MFVDTIVDDSANVRDL